MRVFDLDEKTETRIVIFLLKDIKDGKGLRKKIISGELDCCAIKPSLVVSCFQIVVAANKAALSKKAGKLATKCLNTELLYNLSISRNITQSLNKFGIGDEDKNVVVVIFEENGENKFERMKAEFCGEISDAAGICDYSDISLIKKLYNISDKELGVSELDDSVISRISTKDFGLF